MARIDHIAYRVKDRMKTARFFMDALGYKYQTEFEIAFDDNSKAKCIVLDPPEKTEHAEWSVLIPGGKDKDAIEYHLPPEIFISDGNDDSIVGKWVQSRQGVGGIHHIALQVESVKEMMDTWKEKGYAEFTSAEPLTCPGITQVFTKPSELTNIIYEFIERDKYGFCQENVKDLMISTKDFS